MEGHEEDQQQEFGMGQQTRTSTTTVDSIQTKRLYVGHLNYRTSWQQLKDHFKQAGQVLHADIIVNREGLKSGSGVVEMGSVEEAKRAFEMLNESTLDGFNIFIREDRKPDTPYHKSFSSQPPRSSRYQDNNFRSNNNGKNLYISCKSAPLDSSVIELSELFGKVGKVAKLEVRNGFALVSYVFREDAKKAIEMYNDNEWKDGKQLVVRYDEKSF